MNADAFLARIMVEKAKDESWWWLSFADPALPEGKQFKGVVIVRGRGIATATLVASSLGINPGGEVQGYELIEEPPDYSYTNRLLTRHDARAFAKMLAAKHGQETTEMPKNLP